MPNGIDLSTLVATVGPTVAELVTTPPSGVVAVTATFFEDQDDPLPLTPGGLLMLVGIPADRPAARRSLDRAAQSRFAGIIVKRRERGLESLAQAADGAGLALVAVAEEVSWRRLDALLSAIIAGSGPEGEDPTEADGSTLFSIANAVAGVVGGSVAIEDLGRHVLAYSSVRGQRIDALRRTGILDRQVPPAPTDLEQYHQVMSAEALHRFPQLGDDLPRAAVAIRAGTLPLGTLWAIEPEAGLSAAAESAILDGARLSALHILRGQNTLDLDRLRRGELFQALLDGTGTPEVAWPRLGFAPGDRIALIAVAPGWLDAPDGLLVTRVAHEVARVCAVLRPDAPVVTAARTVYVLVGGAHAHDAAARLAASIISDTPRTLTTPVYAAVSSELTGPRALPRLRDEVDQILRVSTTGMNAPPVASMADVEGLVLLLHVRDELERHPELRQPAVRALLEHDESKGTHLAKSLLAWLEAQQNVHRAADALHVHPNTLRYRLQRVQEVTALNLDDPDRRLATWLELRLPPDSPETGIVR